MVHRRLRRRRRCVISRTPIERAATITIVNMIANVNESAIVLMVHQTASENASENENENASENASEN